VDRIDPHAPVEGGNVRRYTVADGLPDAEQNVALCDRYGHLWFGTLHGLAEFDPTLDAPLTSPRVYIRRVRVRGEEIPLPWVGTWRSIWRTRFPQPDKNLIEIEYAAADLRAASSLRYQINTGWKASTRIGVRHRRASAWTMPAFRRAHAPLQSGR
jgi:hypothetical protein